jgi:hypothetical protein
VGSGDDDGVFASDGELVQRVGKREIVQALVDGGARFDVRRADGVADDDQVRPSLEDVFGCEAFVNGNAPARERRAHGRIEVLVGSGDVNAAGVEQPGEGAHAGSRDGDEMDAAERVVHGVNPRRRLP